MSIITDTNPAITGDPAGDFDAEFADLLRGWNNHQTLKSVGADVPTLWRSHCNLADQRLSANAHRPR